MSAADFFPFETRNGSAGRVIEWYLATGSLAASSELAATAPETWWHRDPDRELIGQSRKVATGYEHLTPEEELIETTAAMKDFWDLCDVRSLAPEDPPAAGSPRAKTAPRDVETSPPPPAVRSGEGDLRESQAAASPAPAPSSVPAPQPSANLGPLVTAAVLGVSGLMAALVYLGVGAAGLPGPASNRADAPPAAAMFTSGMASPAMRSAPEAPPLPFPPPVTATNARPPPEISPPPQQQQQPPQLSSVTGSAALSDAALRRAIVGEWQGGQRLQSYAANEAFALDETASDPARGRWRIDGGTVYTLRAGSRDELGLQIVTLNATDLLLRNSAGVLFPAKRVVPDQGLDQGLDQGQGQGQGHGQDHRTGEVLFEFLRSHHQKASNHDVSGFVADYQSPVEYLDNGRITTADVYNLEYPYYQKWRTIHELITEVKAVDAVTDGWWVLYTLDVHLEDGTGKTRNATAEIEVFVASTPEGPRIAVQRSTVHVAGDSPMASASAFSAVASPGAPATKPPPPAASPSAPATKPRTATDSFREKARKFDNL